jgi:hypothetical protein
MIDRCANFLSGAALDSWLEALAGRTHTTWADLVIAITAPHARGARQASSGSVYLRSAMIMDD